MKYYLSIFLLTLLTSCSLFNSSESGAYVKSKISFQAILKSLSQPWENIKSEGSDLALMNKKSGSIFLINSACRKNDASNLSTLTSSILTGFDSLNIISKENKSFQDRDAIETKFSGKVDGVLSFVNILTIQKNFCIFDFVLISKNLNKLNNDYKAFNDFVNKVTLE